MFLMLDNYDSFTYNLVQYLGELGEEVVTYRNDAISVAEIKALAPTRIMVSPGPCTPNEAGISLELIEAFAWTDDGEIMGLRHKELLVEGVQFHPESILTEHGHALLKNFLDLSK